MYPANTALVLEFLFPTSRPLADWEVRDDGAMVTISAWRLADPSPSAEEVSEAAASTEFAAWREQHTDATKRRRAQARQLLTSSNEPLVVAVRAALKGLGASLREVREAQGKPVRDDGQFLADVLNAIDSGVGEV